MESALLPALTGGLAGSIITLIVQGFLRYWKRPILEIGQDDEGCNVRTQAFLIDLAGKPLKDVQDKLLVCEQRYLRLKVTNKGKTYAKNVSACVTRITYRSDRAGAQAILKNEVFDLKLALTSDRAVFDVAAGAHRYIDLVHCQENGQENRVRIRLCQASSPPVLPKLWPRKVRDEGVCSRRQRSIQIP